MTRDDCAFVYFLEAIVNKSLQESQLSWISLKSQPWSFPPQCFILLLHLLHQSLSSLTFSIPSLLCSCLSTKRCQPLEKHSQVNQLWRLPEVSPLSEFLPKGDWLSGHVPRFVGCQTTGSWGRESLLLRLLSTVLAVNIDHVYSLHYIRSSTHLAVHSNSSKYWTVISVKAWELSTCMYMYTAELYLSDIWHL